MKMENFTESNSGEESATLSLWIIISYYCFVLIGLILNVCISICLIQRKERGIFSLILHLTIVDCLSTFVAVIEIWIINNHSWVLPSKLCRFFSGSEVLINTFVLYETICINFHITSTLNLYLQEIRNDGKSPISLSEEEDSDQFLVSHEEEHYNRNVVIDYRRKKTDIAILVPLFLVWFVGLSVSIPQLTLSTPVTVENSVVLCTIFDTFHKRLLQNLSVAFRIIIPLPLLFLSLVILITRSYQSMHLKNVGQNLLARKTKKVQSMLVLGTVLTILYVTVSLQRQILAILHFIAQEINAAGSLSNFKIPPLQNVTCSNLTNLLSAMAHYACSTLRPIIYILVLPELRYMFRFSEKLKCYKK
ncbi:hypothetical protein PPYR_01784 [Photinus pyralis]|uniref:G-protein coupled receptors family 1 profile domain-containing protein n=1 Tax=Photinus pyralis TaxID=7054 RepID=A0A5N4B5I9_PHOPY|nr:uncharacterized protein LOC116175558 [Photinus pyralis]KAB0804814.1 hypothetical protein PPYR_01784 [Photinus pyralis]